MSNDLSRLMSLAAGIGGRDEPVNRQTGEGYVRRISGTAVTDSASGKVKVQLAGGDPIEVPTSVAVKAGQTVSLLVSGGVATAVGVAGWGDGVQAQADAATTAAAQASTNASTAVSTAKTAARDAATAKTDAGKASEDAAVAIAETKDLVTLRIDSSRGTVFKNSEVSTVITVRCYKRGQEITTREALRQAMLDATARIRWYVLREGDTDWVSLADSDHMLSNDGFTLTVTPDDVSVKCTFKAEIVTD